MRTFFVVTTILVSLLTLLASPLQVAAQDLEANKAVARRWVEEIWNKGDISVIDEIVAEDYVDRSPVPGRGTDREGLKAGVTEFRAAFPDVHISIDAMIAEGDKVVMRLIVTGTHTGGDYMGIAPTGRQFKMSAIIISRLVNGKIVEQWENADLLGQLQQLGAIPPVD